MAKHHNPKISTNGLVLAYDMANTQKSWKGAPTTNLLLSPSDFTSGNWIKTMNSGTVPSVVTETILDRNGNLKAVDKLTLPTDGTYPRIYQSWTPASTATHTFSIWMKSAGGSNLKCEIVVFRNSPWASPSGIITANLTSDWQRFTVSFTPLDTTSHQIYIGSHDTAKGAIIYMDDSQLEVSAVATPFVEGTRTNTQALMDLVSSNTITANSLTYASDNTFSISSGNYITLPPFSITTNEYTVSFWVKRNGGTGVFLWVGANGAGCYFESYGATDIANWYFGPNSPQNSGWGNVLSTTSYVNVTAVINTSNKTILKYINGSLIESSTLTNAITAPGPTGVYRVNNTTAQTWSGFIPVVNFYNRALTAAEISQNFNALRGRFGI